MDSFFPHEKLTCYQLGTSVSRWFRSQRFPTGCADLADQGRRASASVPLNIKRPRRNSTATYATGAS